jgi:hypothetical protein
MCYKQQHSCGAISLEEVEIILKQCGIDRPEEGDEVLKFFHDMGIILWFNQDEIQNIVVIDPINYFVKPATKVICDPNLHISENHEICQNECPIEWETFLKKGTASEKILYLLLKDYNQKHVRDVMLLMEKYSLILNVQNKNRNRLQSYFLIPSLLPSTNLEVEPKFGDLCVFNVIFYIKGRLTDISFISYEKLKKYGFLPKSVFEKLISKLVSFGKQNYFNNEDQDPFLFKQSAYFESGPQRFQIEFLTLYNTLQVTVQKDVPSFGVLKRIQRLVTEILQEFNMNHLHFEVAFPFNEKYLLILDAITNKIISNDTLLELPNKEQVSLEPYSKWLEIRRYKSKYDIFISYRRDFNHVNLTQLFYDMYMENDIEVFLDKHKLNKGENFLMALVKGIINTTVFVPFVSAFSFDRMIVHNETLVDYLLL